MSPSIQYKRFHQELHFFQRHSVQKKSLSQLYLTFTEIIFQQNKFFYSEFPSVIREKDYVSISLLKSMKRVLNSALRH